MIDPAQNIDARLDIAISGDKIREVAKDISPQQCRQVVDAKDRIVTPGLIDLHTHVYDGFWPHSTDPDTAGVQQGVTTVVDAGSSGQATFRGFPKYIIPSFRTRVFCFLHLCSAGLAIVPEIRDWEEVNFDATTATIESYPGLIKGIKLRLVGNTVAGAGVEGVKLAQKVARPFGLPIMVHIGDNSRQVSPTLTQEVLPLMAPGDILSHFLTPKYGGVLRPNGSVLPELREAMERGVILDVARGRDQFSFEVAQKLGAEGILPKTISTDLCNNNVADRVFGLTVTMSNFLALGLELKQLVEMTTINPARALKAEDLVGSLKPGMAADVSILEMAPGKWKFEDAKGQTVEANTLITPRMTVKSGQLIPARPVAQPRPEE